MLPLATIAIIREIQGGLSPLNSGRAIKASLGCFRSPTNTNESDNEFDDALSLQILEFSISQTSYRSFWNPLSPYYTCACLQDVRHERYRPLAEPKES